MELRSARSDAPWLGCLLFVCFLVAASLRDEEYLQRVMYVVTAVVYIVYRLSYRRLYAPIASRIEWFGRAVRAVAQVANVTVDQVLEEKFVLYLRSFDDDSAMSRVWVDSWRDMGFLGSLWMDGSTEYSVEELFAVAFHATLGRMVCAERPGQRLVVPGAARLRLTRENWKPTIISLMTHAQFVVIKLGCGPSLAWEVEQALQLLPSNKIVFICSDDVAADAGALKLLRSLPHGSDIEAAVHEIAAMPKSRRDPLPHVTGALYFVDDWIPGTEPVKRPSSRDLSLPKLLDALGLTKAINNALGLDKLWHLERQAWRHGLKELADDLLDRRIELMSIMINDLKLPLNMAVTVGSIVAMVIPFGMTAIFIPYIHSALLHIVHLIEKSF